MGKKRGKNILFNKASPSASNTSLYLWGRVESNNKAFSSLAEKNKRNVDVPLTELGVSEAEDIKGKALISASSSNGHIVALTDKFEVVGSGINTHGQLLPFQPKTKFVDFRSLKVLPSLRKDLKVVTISCGKDFTAYLTNIGRVYTFGSNRFGQLGHSSDRSPDFVGPRMIQGVPHEVCAQVATGDFTTYVLTKHGKVYSCGMGKNGRLGITDLSEIRQSMVDGKKQYQTTFISELAEFNNDLFCRELEKNVQKLTEVKGPLKGTPVVQIAAGAAHCVAVSVSGKVYGWGSNSHGQLGLRIPASAKEPKEIDSDDEEEEFADGVPEPILLNVENIGACTAGKHHTMLLDTTRKQIFATGSNSHGQLGPAGISIGENLYSLFEVAVEKLVDGSESIVKIAAGMNHSVVLTSESNVLVFGKAEVKLDATSLKGKVTNPADGIQVITKPGAFDVHCNGGLVLMLTATNASELLEKTLDKQKILVDSVPIGILASDVEKADTKDLFLHLRKALFDLHTLNASFLLQGNAKREREKLLKVKGKREDELLDSSFVDIQGWIKASNLFKEVVKNNASRMKVRQLIASLVAQVDSASSSVIGGDQLRALFLLCISPLLHQVSPMEHEFLLLSVFKLSVESRRRFFSWIVADLALQDINEFVQLLVAPLLKRFDAHLAQRKFTKQTVVLCKFLTCLYILTQNLPKNIRENVPSSAFYTKALDNFSDEVLRHMQHTWQSVLSRGGRQFHDRPGTVYGVGTDEKVEFNGSGKLFGLAQYGSKLLVAVSDGPDHLQPLSYTAPEMVLFTRPFLLSANSKRRFLRIQDQVLQQEQMLRFASIGYNPNFNLEVGRGTALLNDTFEALRLLLSEPEVLLRRPLRIKFKGEEGLDAGGVKKEFFLLLSALLFNPDYGYFSEIGKTHLLWFNGTIDPTLLKSEGDQITYEEYMQVTKSLTEKSLKAEDFQIIGIIMGLAIYNDTLLDVRFPSAMYRLLLNEFKSDQLDIQSYKKFDDEGAQQLEYVLNITDAEELESLDLRYEIAQEAFGVVREVEIVPGGSKKKVTMKNKEDYVKAYIKFKMYSPYIERQAAALTRGFRKIMTSQQSSIRLFMPEELELLLCGTPELDFSLLKGNCVYEGGYSPEHATIKRFWEIAEEFAYEQKKLFLKFCTGSSRAPVGGLKNVRFKIQRAGPDSTQLPTSYTCFNTLMLPDYSSKAKMRRLLMLAIENSEGFGLQ